MEKIWKEYGTAMRAIQFVRVVSMSDLLTRDTVYAGIECMMISWLHKLLNKMDGL
jgi:hypothetical protein